MEEKPLVSIILPIQNTDKFLKACIKSLLSQSYTNFEIIGIDDNSKDSSFRILKQFHLSDKRVRCYKNKKRYGLAVCFNRAFKKANGSFIAFIDPSDMNTSGRIKKQLSYLQSHPKVVAVGSQCTFVTNSNKRYGKSDFPVDCHTIYQTLTHGSSILFETFMINKKVLPKDLLYVSPKVRPPFLYHDLFVKLAQYRDLTNLSESLYYRRQSLEQHYQKTLQILPTYLTMLIRSITLYDYRPSLRSLFA